MEGISAIEIDRLIPFHKRFSPKSFINVGLKAKLERWAIKTLKSNHHCKKYKTIGKRSLSTFDAVKEFYIYYEILKVPFEIGLITGKTTHTQKRRKSKNRTSLTSSLKKHGLYFFLI